MADDIGWTFTCIVAVFIIGYLLFTGIFTDELKDCDMLEDCIDANQYIWRCQNESLEIWDRLNCSMMNVTIYPPIYNDIDVCEMTVEDCIAMEYYFSKDDPSFRMDCIPENAVFKPLDK